MVIVLLLMYMDFLHTSTYQQGKAFTLMTVQHLGCVACLIKLNYNFKKLTQPQSFCFFVMWLVSLFCVVFGRPFVKRFALCYRTIVLSVTLVYCGQTVGWIKMKLGRQVRLRPGHIVLDGDPAPPHQKGSGVPNFRPISIVAKRLNTSRWHLLWPRRLCFRWGPSPLHKNGRSPPIFGPCLL